jgi:hypothetical protein
MRTIEQCKAIEYANLRQIGTLISSAEIPVIAPGVFATANMAEGGDWMAGARRAGFKVEYEPITGEIPTCAGTSYAGQIGFRVTVSAFAIGDGATLCGWSDRTACTVIARTPHTMTIQEDTATLLNGMGSGEKDALVMHPGGFAGHVEGTQRYSYAADPKGHEHVARLTKRGWTVNGSRVAAGRNHHHDYNF